MSDAPVPMNEPPRRRRPPSRNVDPETGERLTLPEKVLPPTLAPMEEPESEPTGGTEAQDSAYDIFEQELKTWGLEDLKDFLYQLVFEKGYTSIDVIRAEVRRTETYRQRFAANQQRLDAGFNALSEAEYIGLETTFAQYMRASGLPAGFYDSNEDFTALIAANVSPGELAERINTGYEAVANADPEVIAEMRRLYNIGDGELAAYFLDPERATPMLLRQAKAAEVAGGAVQAGVTISAAEAETLAEEGITQQGARAGFGVISEGDIFQMTTEEIAAGEQALTREEQIGAVFGTDPQAAQRLRRQQRRRQAAFEAGGRFAGAGQEITGLR